MRKVIVFALTIPIALHLFRDRGLQLATDELLWLAAMICALVAVLTVEFLIRFVSIPAKRDSELKDRIDQLCPAYPPLTEIQLIILRACGNPDQVTEHWVVDDAGGCTLDGVPLTNNEGMNYVGDIIQSHLWAMEGYKLLRNIHIDKDKMSFVLTIFGCDMLRDQLGGSEV